MSNSTYCDDHYEQPEWMKRMERLERQIKKLEAEKDKERRMLDKVCKWIDKQCEPIKPNFKEGDWVVVSDKVEQITKVEEMPYNTHQYWTSDNTWFGDATDAKIWTIRDAKPGDVVTSNECSRCPWIGLVKSFNNKGGLDVYCYLEAGHNHIRFESRNHRIDNLFPATKDQRDLLFLKIKEAGYEWDTEKKELKKIEQKLTELSENRSKELSLSLQIQAYLNTASDELYAKGKPLYSEERIEDIHKCMLMWQKLHNAYFYQNPAWSEEELDSITAAINNLEYLKNNYVYHQMGLEPAITFLKSLKYRVLQQPKQEWSEEDETGLTNTIIMLKEGASLHFNKKDITKAVDFLKSLKDRVQPKQVWSEEDEKIVEHLINLHKVNLKVNHYPDLEVNKKVNELRMFFKSLRPQNRWKPSDEQMNALDIAIRCGIQLGTWEETSLKDLREQLKKL